MDFGGVLILGHGYHLPAVSVDLHKGNSISPTSGTGPLDPWDRGLPHWPVVLFLSSLFWKTRSADEL